MAAPVYLWTEQAVSDLKRLHSEGLSASEIAKQIGCPSRNAVIGKVHRLGLVRQKPKRPEPKAPQPAPPPRPVNFARKPSRSADERREAFQAVADKALDRFDELMPQSPNPVRFLDSGRFQCAAPQRGWDSKPVTEKMVCGRPVQAGTSWCPACLAVVSPSPKFAAFKHRSMVGGIAA